MPLLLLPTLLHNNVLPVFVTTLGTHSKLPSLCPHSIPIQSSTTRICRIIAARTDSVRFRRSAHPSTRPLANTNESPSSTARSLYPACLPHFTQTTAQYFSLNTSHAKRRRRGAWSRNQPPLHKQFCRALCDSSSQSQHDP